eukprot:TRINITY_DN4542_c0_g1_i2.p1 TRINITY_DN4542_c0_g1~~TRINITY_DN4542_c0_g1_i2.p1  ORF type:complete len:206 (-),score=59.25 TRINITY_DN4542_c0_g1_i2:109-651(-)
MNNFKLGLLLVVVCCLSFGVGSAVTVNEKAVNAANDTSFECDFCEVVVVLAEELIKVDNLTSAEALADLKKLCKIVPGNYTTECNIFMLLVAPSIIKDLENGEKAETLCAKYKLCNDTLSFDSTNKGFENFSVCKVITMAMNYILDKRNEDGIVRDQLTPVLLKDFSEQQALGRLTAEDC